MTDTVVGVMVIGIEGPPALKCYGTAHGKRRREKRASSDQISQEGIRKSQSGKEPIIHAQ